MNTNIRTLFAASAAPCFLLLATAAFAQDPGPPGLAPNSTAIPATPTVQVVQDGFVIINGRVFQIRGGQATLVQREMSFRVSPTGITGFDGRPVIVPDGQMITTDGRLVPLPAGVNGLPVAPRTVPPGAPNSPGVITPGTSPGTNVTPGTSPGTGAATAPTPTSGSRTR
jgi:hypothetical protein